jgi:FMN hydrolase / 5-amino-6-(5-phospho-D-ribitylamino)uracil phosphatase
VSGGGVVSFDLDETLWAFMPMMDGALTGMIAALERRRPELAGAITLSQLHEQRRVVGEERLGSYVELRLESFRRALAEHGVSEPGLAEWMVDAWMAERPTAVRLHPDVEPELDALAGAGRVLGAITNGNFPFAQLPLAKRFAFIVHAEEVGELKPAAAPFLRAAEICRGDPARWVHAGDSLETDIAGAQACGMKAVWINRAGDPLPEGYSPDAELPTLTGLAVLVTRLLGD